jgi:hypothetical protein
MRTFPLVSRLSIKGADPKNGRGSTGHTGLALPPGTGYQLPTERDTHRLPISPRSPPPPRLQESSRTGKGAEQASYPCAKPCPVTSGERTARVLWSVRPWIRSRLVSVRGGLDPRCPPGGPRQGRKRYISPSGPHHLKPRWPGSCSRAQEGRFAVPKVTRFCCLESGSSL